ncbi:amidase [Phormidium tenue FACHB-886]|nr:amidase [Phormidium tenue FACHB-886]
MTSKLSLLDLSISEARAAMEKGELSAVQLAQYYLDRISVYDDELTGTYLNSVVTISPDVLEQAERLDKLRAEGTILGPLHGIPIVVKDSYNVAGLATTGAVRGFEDFISDDDAFVVEKLREAGAIILGKTNMDSFASGVRGVSNLFGGTRNPYNLGKETGGSSSGTGSAIAANFAMAGTGGETGGSIVIPSAANSLVGIKPSRGLISVDGTIPLGPFRDVIGPMTRSVTDTAIMMDAMVKEDPEDLWFSYKPEGANNRPESYASPGVLNDKSLEGKVLAVPKIYVGKDQKLGEGFKLDPEVEKLFEVAKHTLEEQGATVIEVDTAPYLSKWLNRAEEWEYGWPDDAFPDWNRENAAFYLEEFIKGLNNPDIDSLVDVKTAITGEFSDTALVQTLKALEEGKPRSFEDEALQIALNAVKEWRVKDFEPFVKEHDIDAFVFPTLRAAIPDESGPTGPIPFDRNADAESNVMGLPVVTVPMGYTSGNAPASLSIMGDYYGEAEILGYAYDFEQATKYRETPNTVPELEFTDELLYGGNTSRDTGKIFILKTGSGRDLITDYQAERDQLGLIEGIQFDDLTITSIGQNTRIQLDNDVLAVLRGVDASLITATEFV